jgi:hypothetical protein
VQREVLDVARKGDQDLERSKKVWRAFAFAALFLPFALLTLILVHSILTAGAPH